MAEYIEILTSVQEIQVAARNLVRAGGQIASAARSASATIAGLESSPTTFPPDDFTGAFLSKYRAPAGSAGPANKAVLASAIELGGNLKERGELVGDALAALVATDEDGARSINSTV